MMMMMMMMRTCPFWIGSHSDVIAENCSDIVEAARFVSNANHLPITISVRNADAKIGERSTSALAAKSVGGTHCCSR